MYDIPERTDIRKCIITEETIREGRTPLLLTKSEIDSGVDETNYAELPGRARRDRLTSSGVGRRASSPVHGAGSGGGPRPTAGRTRSRETARIRARRWARQTGRFAYCVRRSTRATLRWYRFHGTVVITVVIFGGGHQVRNRFVAALGVIALVATACGGSSASASPAASAAAAIGGGPVSRRRLRRPRPPAPARSSSVPWPASSRAST